MLDLDCAAIFLYCVWDFFAVGEGRRAEWGRKRGTEEASRPGVLLPEPSQPGPVGGEGRLLC